MQICKERVSPLLHLSTYLSLDHTFNHINMLMHVVRSASLAFLVATNTVVSSPVRTRSPYIVKDVHNVPNRWWKVGPAPAHKVINLHIGLKQGQFDELERHLYEGTVWPSTRFSSARVFNGSRSQLIRTFFYIVSIPSHPRYGQHLTFDEVNELIKPSGDTSDQVHEWLSDNGIEPAQLSYNKAKDWIKLSLPVNAVEKLLDTKYSIFEHEDGDRVIRAPKWSLPAHLHEHIEAIQPTNSFFRPAGRRKTLKPVVPISEISQGPPEDFAAVNTIAATPESTELSVAKACNTSAVTSLCLRTFYGTKGYKPQVPGKNMVGLTDFLLEANNRSDVQIFLEKYRKDAVSEAETFTVDVINGGDNQQTPDVRYIFGALIFPFVTRSES